MAKKKNIFLIRIFIFIILIFFVTITMIPFAWMLSSSLKYNQDVFSIPIQWIPQRPKWSNYVEIWKSIPLFIFTINTFKITLIVTALQLVTSSFAAYAFSKLEFKNRDKLFLIYIGTIAIPWQVYMVPQFIFLRKLGLNDNHLSLILLQSFSAFGVFMMRQFYMNIPDDLCEAARIDGMSEYLIWFKIMLPLSKPAISTLIIFTFVNTWNDFLGPLIYLKTEAKKTIQLGLRMFIGQYSAEYGLIMAASVLALIPVLIVFITLQKYYVQGVTTTGLKG